MASVVDPGPAPAHHNMTTLVSAWHEASQQLKLARERETELRRQVLEAAFPAAPDKGTQRVPVGYGKELKGTFKLNHTVDREALLGLEDQLPADVAGRVFRYKAEVVDAELARVTDPSVKELLSRCITSRPASPSLEIVDAKGSQP